jgi:hypothetical protein
VTIFQIRLQGLIIIDSSYNNSFKAFSSWFIIFILKSFRNPFRSEYENEVNNELKDKGMYKEIKEDLMVKIENKLKKKVESMYTVLASLRSTLGYRALTSEQNMIAPFGKGC